MGSVDSDHGDRTESDDELTRLVHRLIDAIEKRGRRGWLRDDAHSRRLVFEHDLKACAKKLTNRISAVVSDRDIKADVRARVYADVLSIANAILVEQARRAERRRTLRASVRMVGGVVIILVLAYLAIAPWY